MRPVKEKKQRTACPAPVVPLRVPYMLPINTPHDETCKPRSVLNGVAMTVEEKAPKRPTRTFIVFFLELSHQTPWAYRPSFAWGCVVLHFHNHVSTTSIRNPHDQSRRKTPSRRMDYSIQQRVRSCGTLYYTAASSLMTLPQL